MPKSRTLLIEVSCETFPDHTDEQFKQWVELRLVSSPSNVTSKHPDNPLIFSRLTAKVVAVDEEIAFLYHQDFQERINDDMIRLDQQCRDGRYGDIP